jgi:glycerophosphoryl diester phosphodiesterase
MRLIGHRGASARYAENTLAAFRAAWASGAGGVELDVRLSADGEVVVFHDADGRRTAGQSGRIAGTPWADLARWRVGGGPVPPQADVL